ncbi:MAG TPA: hypothetical protein VFX89_08325 [Gammaproteobacteria bacterium]|nr:hypothetical protein [Gammaproteobacteria bacterium]
MPSDSNPLLRFACWAPLAVAAAMPAISWAAPSALFAGEAPLAIRIEAPFQTVLRQRDDPEYQPGRVAAAGTQGDVAVDVRVRVRGKSRVKACDFPPLLLNFPKDQPDGSPFAGENRLKLVTHCSSSASFDQYNALERQVYRVLNLLTESSLRIRPVNVTYFDSGRGRELVAKAGFLIEDEERFAERSGLTPVSVPRVEAASYDPAALALLDTFEYFIGNTDWSSAEGPAGSSCCHNVVPFVRPDGVHVPVPYDFDASGIVNAPYALPDARLPISTVRQRLFRGRCREMTAFDAPFARFKEQRAAIEALFSTDAGLSDKASKGAREYIAAFYETIGDPKKAERAFRVACPR